jgi:hypothetical protein
MIVKLRKPEIDLLKAVHDKFRLDEVMNISFDGIKSVWVILDEDGSRWHGILDGETAVWTRV